MLSERKKKILEAVISENIKKAEPISSKELQERFFNDVSSATIRNDLMHLEEMGYLFQPHTSSGRIPTTAGFKKYIEELMPEKELTKNELDELKQNFKDKIGGIEDLAQVVAKTISRATNYASVVYMGLTAEATIESVKLVKITDDTCLIILVTDLGVIKDLMINVPQTTSEEDAMTVSRILTEVLAGAPISGINEYKAELLVSAEMEKYRKIFDLVISAIEQRKEKPVVKTDGASNLLSQPEYESVDKARNAIKLFESTEVLTPLLGSGNDLEISIKVGASETEDCSVVSASYKVNGKNIGRAGIVGPVRMDYAKAVSVLKSVNERISAGIMDLIPASNKNKKHKENRNGKYRKRGSGKNFQKERKS